MKSATWPIVTIQSIQAAKKHATTGGPFGSKLGGRDYVETGVPVIRGTNLPLNSRFSLDDFVFVSEEKADSLMANNAHPGDVVFTQRGTLGQVGVIPKTCGFQRFIISQSQMKITVDESQCDPEFVYYYFRSEETVKTIKGMAISSGVPHINLTILREFPIPKPPLRIQHKIAAILSAYDDLIENNTRRIAILEEMAQSIYREWFVNFRFPGHENVKLIDSGLGKIPEGWEVMTLKNVCAEKKGIQTGPFGSQLHKSDYTDDGTPVVMPKDISQSRISTASIARVPAEVCDRLPRHRLEVGDTVCARRGEIGRNTFVTERESRWMCGTGCMRMRPQKSVISPRFLFDYLCTPGIVSLIAGKSAGAIMPNLNIGIMESVPVLLPPRVVQLSYESLAMENLELVSTLVSKNNNLRTTRDLLLPKLISGKVDVEDLNIDVGMIAEELEEAIA